MGNKVVAFLQQYDSWMQGLEVHEGTDKPTFPVSILAMSQCKRAGGQKRQRQILCW